MQKVNYITGDIINEKPVIEIDPTFVVFKIKNSKLQLKQIGNRIKSLETNVQFFKKDHNRLKELRKNKLVSVVKFDEKSYSIDVRYHRTFGVKPQQP